MPKKFLTLSIILTLSFLKFANAENYRISNPSSKDSSQFYSELAKVSKTPYKIGSYNLKVFGLKIYNIELYGENPVFKYNNKFAFI